MEEAHFLHRCVSSDEQQEVPSLPVEVLEMIFEFMEIGDRKSGVLVSKQWRAAGEAPRFWSWVQLPPVEEDHHRERVIWMLTCGRLAKARMEELFIKRCEVVNEDLLRAMIGHRRIKRIVISDPKQSLLPARLSTDLLVEALISVESLDFECCLFLTDVQVALMTRMTRMPRYPLKNLSLGSHWSRAPPNLFASALTKLVEVKICSGITFAQLQALMKAIDQGNTTLKKISLHKLSCLPTRGEKILDLRPLVNLEEVELHCCLRKQELALFFEALSPTTRLRKLMLDDGGNGYGHGNGWVMDNNLPNEAARAVNFLEEVTMSALPYQVVTNSFCFPDTMGN